MTLISEIFEQPQRLTNLLFQQRQTVEEIARVIHTHQVGTFSLPHEVLQITLPVMPATCRGLAINCPLPSRPLYYKAPPRLKNALVVGISQSGQSPDILKVMEGGKRQHCLTLAITNSPASPLGHTAD